MRGSWQAAAGLAAPSLARQSTRVWDVHQPRGKKPSAHVCARVHRDAAWPWGSGRTPLFVPRRDPAPRAGCARVTLRPSPQDTTVVFSHSHLTARPRGLLCTLQRFQVCFPALANHFPSSGTSESQRATWRAAPGPAAQQWDAGMGFADAVSERTRAPLTGQCLAKTY